MSNDEITYPSARTPRFIHAAPQFRPIQRGRRRKALERVYTSADGSQELKIRLFNELDIADQDILLCILAIARDLDRGDIVSDKVTNDKFIELRNSLDLNGENVMSLDAVSIETTAYELLKETGRPTGKREYQWLMQSLERLGGVTFRYREKPMNWGFNLLSWSFNEDTGAITILINPVSAWVILDDSKGYTLTHRGERHKLVKEEHKALHAVLCGLVDPGATRSLKVDGLADRVWARYDDEVSAQAISKRRNKIIFAAGRIDSLDGWKCVVRGKGNKAQLIVTRKKYY